jgi:hypothetical protein
MSHNGPNPDRLLHNNRTYQVMMLVAVRYGLHFASDGAVWAQREIERRMDQDGLSLMSAPRAFEHRPMAERLIGRPRKYPVTYDYEER